MSFDVLERGFVVGLYGWLVWSVAQAVGGGASWVNLAQLVAEGLNVVFILIRRRAITVSYRARDWLVSFGAVAGSLMARPGGSPAASPALAGALILAGLSLQVWAKLTLRRGFGIAPADRGLVIGGPYRYVRHPMYLGYLLGWIGFYALNPTVWNTNVYLLCALMQWVRIEAEEAVLSGSPDHAAYRAKVPHLILPGLF